jgi:hypothetical protein
VRWLIRLYPPAWRRRYGDELAELLETQPFSLRTSIDLIAGAIDAWVHPQASTSVVADAKGGESMLPKMLQLRGFGQGPQYTPADSLKAAAVTIIGALLGVPVIYWARQTYGPNSLLETFAVTYWLIPMLFGVSFTELKGRSLLVKALFIGVPSLFIVGVTLFNA